MQEVIQQALGILRGIWKFRWPGLVVSWVVAIVGCVAVWKIPDQFEASARIYIDTDSILKPLMTGLAVQPNVEQQIAMLTRTLLSRPNVEKLIRMADLDLKSQSKSDQENLVEKLTQGVQMRAAAGGVNLYTLNYRDAEPERAKRVIQSLVSIFVESGLGASRKDTDSAKTFLNEQIKAYEAKLEEAESRLKAFRLRNIDTQLADGKDSSTLMVELAGQLQTARLQLREAENARDAAKLQLAQERAGTQSNMPNLLSDTGGATVSTPELDSRIDSQRKNLDALLQRYTEQHPDVISVRRLLRDLEEQRKKEVIELKRVAQAQAVAAAAAAANGGPGSSLAAQELSRVMAASEVQVAALKARVAEYTARVAAARESLKTAPQIEAEAAQLNRDYAVTKKGYEELVARRQSAMLSGDLDVASGVAEFRLIDPPRVAPKPVAPNRFLLLPGVLLAALAAGLGFSFVASQLRPTFASAEELRQFTGLPLLGVVTQLVTDDDRRRDRISLMRFVAASGSLVGLFVAGLIVMSFMTRFGG